MPRKKSSRRPTKKWQSYAERLTDPRWQLLKARVILRDKGICLECGGTSTTLHVHHPIYLRGRDPWEYEESILQTLCEDCHDKREEAILGLKMVMITFTTEDFYAWTARIKADRSSLQHLAAKIKAAAPPPSNPPYVPKKSDPTVWDQIKADKDKDPVITKIAYCLGPLRSFCLKNAIWCWESDKHKTKVLAIYFDPEFKEHIDFIMDEKMMSRLLGIEDCNGVSVGFRDKMKEPLNA